MRIRCAGIVEIDGGYCLMYRKNVKKEGSTVNYYTIPGGGLEDGETVEEAAIREIKEELGIDVEVEELLYNTTSHERNKEEYFFKCKYIGGEFGTGDGPEFSNDPKYKDRGEFIPLIVKKEEIDGLNILPKEIIKYLK